MCKKEIVETFVKETGFTATGTVIANLATRAYDAGKRDVRDIVDYMKMAAIAD